MPRVTHGHSYTGHVSKTYRIWRGIKQRCYNPKASRYKNYGERGIRMCDRWYNSFETFLEDMGECPSENHSIDRKNNDGNYEPSNCRWALEEQQANNRQTSRLLTYDGKTQTISLWAREYGISKQLLKDRIDSGLSVEDALAIKVSRKNKGRRQNLVTYNGVTKTLSSIAEEYGIERRTISKRLKLGWTIEEALTFPVRKFRGR